MSVYADTSFLFSLYVSDANSPLAANLIQRANLPFHITSLSELELVNAFYQRLFRRELPASKVKAAAGLFESDIADGIFERKSLSEDIFRQASSLSRRHTGRIGTRTLDVLHVACAVVFGSSEFYTFDQNQEKLARTAGLKVRGLHS